MNDVVINKIQSIQHCVARAREEYQSDPEGFGTNYSAQDAALLNVLRACEQTIDLANHIIKRNQMGIPASSAESFDLLYEKAVIDAKMAQNMHKMVYFRNLLIHQYQDIDIEIAKSVIVSGLDDLVEFGERILKFVYK